MTELLDIPDQRILVPDGASLAPGRRVKKFDREETVEVPRDWV